MNKNLAVCVVGNFKYLYKYFSKFKKDIRVKGKYSGEIVIVTSIWCPTFLLISIYGKDVTVLRFKKIKFSQKTNETLNNNSSNGEPNRNKHKSFQWHKLHLFDKKLKDWNYIFYLDLKSFIHGDITELLNFTSENTLFARSDTYPEYKNQLSSQFDDNSSSFSSLADEYDLGIKDYFQTCLLFYNTNIINSNTKKDLIFLAEKYPCTITNEQAICNLYFIFEKNQYKELPHEIGESLTFYYWMVDDKEVLITKQDRTKYK
jgi:hypothetical protein